MAMKAQKKKKCVWFSIWISTTLLSVCHQSWRSTFYCLFADAAAAAAAAAASSSTLDTRKHLTSRHQQRLQIGLATRASAVLFTATRWRAGSAVSSFRRRATATLKPASLRNRTKHMLIRHWLLKGATNQSICMHWPKMRFFLKKIFILFLKPPPLSCFPIRSLRLY
jgi:hypothetical protein